MGLFRSTDRVRVSDEDGIAGFLTNKVSSGANISVSVQDGGRELGQQLVISSINGAGNGPVVTTGSNLTVLPGTSMVIIDAGGSAVEIVLPNPAESPGWLTLLAVSNSYPISLNFGASKIFDGSNIDFNSPGDSIILANDRINTWYCISRYTACIPYS